MILISNVAFENIQKSKEVKDLLSVLMRYGMISTILEIKVEES